MAQARNTRLRTLGIAALLGLIVIGFLAWWFLFRDNSAASVDTVEAAEARQQAIDEAAARSDSADDTSDTAPTGDVAEGDASGSASGSDQAGDASADDSSTAVDTGQPDSAASVGSPSDGVWNVDTTIGTFGPECLEVVCSAGFVGFRINEELAGIGAKTVVGRTPAVSGTMEIEGTRITSVEITADMTQLITDNSSRTSAMRTASGGLETDTFPEASFVLTEPIELGQLPVEGVPIDVVAVGDLTVHGTTNRVSIPLTAEQQARLVVVYGTLEDMALADYGIPIPSAAVVVSVEEVADMELQLFFSR